MLRSYSAVCRRLPLLHYVAPPVTIRPYRSKRFTIFARTPEADFKLFQIAYSNQDGAIFVNPANYFRHTNGVAAHLRIPANGGQPVQVEMGGDPQTARLTTKLVKYSHHPTGYAHFSLTDQLEPALQIHKRAVPLADQAGHLFTMHVKSVRAFRDDHFDLAAISPTEAAKRTPVGFTMPVDDDSEIAFIGRLYTEERLRHMFAWKAGLDGCVGPILVGDLNDPNVQYVMLAPPQERPLSDHILLLTCRTVALEESVPGPMLLFIGGFDRSEQVNDLTADTTILALKYPATNWEELSRSLV